MATKAKPAFRLPWSRPLPPHDPRLWLVAVGNAGCGDLKGARGTIPIEHAVVAWESPHRFPGAVVFGPPGIWVGYKGPANGHRWPRDIPDRTAWQPIHGTTTDERLCDLFYLFHYIVTETRLDPIAVHREFMKIEEYCGAVGEHFNP